MSVQARPDSREPTARTAAPKREHAAATELQRALTPFFAAMAKAVELDERERDAFLSIVCIRVATETSRCWRELAA